MHCRRLVTGNRLSHDRMSFQKDSACQSATWLRCLPLQASLAVQVEAAYATRIANISSPKLKTAAVWIMLFMLTPFRDKYVAANV